MKLWALVHRAGQRNADDYGMHIELAYEEVQVSERQSEYRLCPLFTTRVAAELYMASHKVGWQIEPLELPVRGITVQASSQSSATSSEFQE